MKFAFDVFKRKSNDFYHVHQIHQSMASQDLPRLVEMPSGVGDIYTRLRCRCERRLGRLFNKLFASSVIDDNFSLDLID